MPKIRLAHTAPLTLKFARQGTKFQIQQSILPPQLLLSLRPHQAPFAQLSPELRRRAPAGRRAGVARSRHRTKRVVIIGVRFREAAVYNRTLLRGRNVTFIHEKHTAVRERFLLRNPAWSRTRAGAAENKPGTQTQTPSFCL